MASWSKTIEYSNYRVYFERIFKLQGWNLNFVFTRGKLKLAQITGGKDILTLIILIGKEIGETSMCVRKTNSHLMPPTHSIIFFLRNTHSILLKKGKIYIQEGAKPKPSKSQEKQENGKNK